MVYIKSGVFEVGFILTCIRCVGEVVCVRGACRHTFVYSCCGFAEQVAPHTSNLYRLCLTL